MDAGLRAMVKAAIRPMVDPESAHKSVCEALTTYVLAEGMAEAEARVGSYTNTQHVQWCWMDDPDDEDGAIHVVVDDFVGSCCACAGAMAGVVDEEAPELEQYRQHMEYLVDRATITRDWADAKAAFAAAVTRAIIAAD